MPSDLPCECGACQSWRKQNLEHGSLFSSNLTQESIQALQKKNEPKGKRAERRKKRGL